MTDIVQESPHHQLGEQIDLEKVCRFTTHLKILVCGKVGVGKSSLINSILGHKLCKVNDPGLDDGHLDAGTTKVQETPPFRIGNIVIDLFDSPGLQDGQEKEKQYLEDMYQKCKDVDLFLYCVQMTDARFGSDNKKSLELFTKKFGSDFWKRCVLVMTKANLVVPSGKNAQQYHKKLYDVFLERFRQELMEKGVSDMVCSEIPACAAGLCYVEEESDVPLEEDPTLDDDRYIWYVSDKAKPAEKKMDFLTELWVICLERMPNPVSRQKLLKCTANRLEPERESKEIIEAKERYEKEIRDGRAELEHKIEALQVERKSKQSRRAEEEVSSVPEAPPSYHRACRLAANEDHYNRLIKMEKEDNKLIEKALVTVAATGVTTSVAAGGYAGASLTGASIGAAIGSIVPGVGTTIGAVIGGIAGAGGTSAAIFGTYALLYSFFVK